MGRGDGAQDGAEGGAVAATDVDDSGERREVVGDDGGRRLRRGGDHQPLEVVAGSRVLAKPAEHGLAMGGGVERRRSPFLSGRQ